MSAGYSRRTWIGFGIAAIILALIMAAPRPAAVAQVNEISDPAPFVWTYVASPEPPYVGVLEYGEATFSINGETLTTRAYRQEGGAYSLPRPTIYMTPVREYVVGI